jgi:hypothetical protein
VVNRMDEEIISQIASETEDKIREREKVLDKLDLLKHGARALEQYAIRPGSGRLLSRRVPWHKPLY